MGETGLFKFLFPARKDMNCTLALRESARCLLREMHEITQAVLNIIQFGAVAQPFPIQIGIRAQDPGQGFHQARVQVSLPAPSPLPAPLHCGSGRAWSDGCVFSGTAGERL